MFGLLPRERLERQAGASDYAMVAAADAIFGDAAVHWLVENPGTMIVAANGRPLGIAVEERRAAAAMAAIERRSDEFPSVTTEALGPRYIRKLRTRSPMLALSLEDVSVTKAERLLFANVYKGVTDVVTKWLWPEPALWATRLAARLRISPNAITVTGMALTVLAGLLFYRGGIAAALVAAWTMTFLDTVDGKLARVTVTSSRIGNLLDHGTDIIHPPLWWLCLAQGLAGNDPGASRMIWTMCWIILGAYVVGRAVELSFHRFFGFNGFLYARIDSMFRLVVARRNILLLIMSAGLLLGQATAAFAACAGWSVISTVIQAVRLAQAGVAARKHRLSPWIA
ncbi:MAG: CDP-alcohol phosphatidyltransferase family protein [Pseudomonadota bacterium]|nr:CDP-alcohol phosphatidyltransferase family protein [Pseudomonadota bacterium]